MAERPIAEWLPVAEIVESPFNTRRVFDPERMKVLEESIRAHGVQQPVLTRPRAGGGYELVFGARRLRASCALGLEKIPARVADLGDDEVLELQVIENRDREDVHPLDEAQHYRALHDQHGRSVDELVARLGVSRGTVYARLKMAALDRKAAETLREADTAASILLEVARIQDPAAQREAAREISETDYQGDPLSVREAREILRRRYHLRLRSAGFPLEDEDLLPAAGSCTACPKRSGNQAELFADLSGKGSADVCTDPKCFAAKREAWAQRQLDVARETADEVLEGKDAQKLFRQPYWGEKRHHVRHGSKYVDLADPCDDDPKRRSYQRLLPKKKRPPITAAVAPDGRVHELVRKADLGKALREAGHDFRAPRRERAGTGQAELRRKQRAEAFVTDRVLEAIGAAAAAGEASDGHALWRLLAEVLVDEIWTEYAKGPARRRGVDGHPRLDLAKWVAKASEAECRGLVVELVAARGARRYGSDWRRAGFSEGTRRAGALFGVDVAAVQRAARADLKRLAKASAPKKKPKTKKRSSPKSGRGDRRAR